LLDRRAAGEQPR